jgi:type II secretory pathway component PulF
MRLDVTRAWAKTQFSASARVRLYRKIAKMLTNGLPLLRILEVLRERASDNGRKPQEPLAIVLDDCRRQVQNGRMLSESLEGWAPRPERMILLAGEQSGNVEAALLAVVDVVQAQQRIQAVIVGGLVYPSSILALILGYVYLFGTRVIPEFTRITDPTTWHGPARSLYLMSEVVQHWMFAIVGVLVLVVGGIAAALPRWRGNLRVFADRFAPFSIYRLVVGSGFLLAFSALQTAGVTVEKSLSRLSDMADPWLRERLDGALLGVRSGLNCGEAMRNAGYGFPSAEVIDDLCVYAEFRGFGEALKVLADEWRDEGIEQISNQMKILNGVAILVMAAVIGWLVTGFFGIQHEIATMTRAVH